MIRTLFIAVMCLFLSTGAFAQSALDNAIRNLLNQNSISILNCDPCKEYCPGVTELVYCVPEELTEFSDVLNRIETQTFGQCLGTNSWSQCGVQIQAKDILDDCVPVNGSLTHCFSWEREYTGKIVDPDAPRPLPEIVMVAPSLF